METATKGRISLWLLPQSAHCLFWEGRWVGGWVVD